jgi:hypothetical protein
MADEIDRANDTADAITQRAIDAARAGAANIPAGDAGDCDLCEDVVRWLAKHRKARRKVGAGDTATISRTSSLW